MIPLRLNEIAAATGGEVHPPEAGDVLVDGPVVTDSRQCTRGSLYVARVGEHADGHLYAGAAASTGAVGALATRPLTELPAVVVPDTQLAFGRLAHLVLERAGVPLVVGVTGSSGKTSTKDLLAQVLAAHGETVANIESFNGEIGVPLTVCRVTTSTRHLVVEMGARGVGHIAYLTTIAPPRIGVVLNVGVAHVGEFGGREQIALAKGELVAALPADGVAVLNADDPLVAAMASRTSARVLLVGEAMAADVRASSVILDHVGRPNFTVHTAAGAAHVALGLHGRHHVGNALAVIAVALEAGMSLADTVAALAAARPANRWRMEVTERADGVTVVNDAYNANPDSMGAALRALVAMNRSAEGQPRRTWAVLGEMFELGEASAAEHAGVGALAAQLHVDRLVTVGAGAEPIAAGALAAGMPAAQVLRADGTDTAYAMLERDMRPGDVVVFKSSRDAGLRWLGDRFAGKEVGS